MIMSLLADTNSCFRRTLVGLKYVAQNVGVAVAAFQTYPRGFEVPRQTDPTASPASFRRTLVGLKSDPDPDNPTEQPRFRRTLVGLKSLGYWDPPVSEIVSDVPSWG